MKNYSLTTHQDEGLETLTFCREEILRGKVIRIILSHTKRHSKWEVTDASVFLVGDYRGYTYPGEGLELAAPCELQIESAYSRKWGLNGWEVALKDFTRRIHCHWFLDELDESFTLNILLKAWRAFNAECTDWSHHFDEEVAS